MLVSELIFEIYTEEIPHHEQIIQTQFAMSFLTIHLKKFHINNDNIEVYSTPCRLAILIYNIPEFITIEEKKIRGVPISSTPEVFSGFCNKISATKSDLSIENEYYVYYQKEQQIEAKDEILLIIKSFMDELRQKFKTRMKWAVNEQEWIRPIRNIANSMSGDASTIGHKFLFPESFKITSIAKYKTELRERMVILDCNERVSMIQTALQKYENDNQLQCISGYKLIEEVACLCEYPDICIGEFDKKYLKLPEKVLILTIEKNQRYFLFKDQNGNIANKFGICINGKYDEKTKQNILHGNLNVLRARLEDAEYYITQDLNIPLEDRLESLKHIVFHKDAGSVYDRVQRMLQITSQIKFHDTIKDNIETAIKLSKCDLTTELVQSFPELQGYVGGIYAKMHGYSKDISTAISEQYKPAFDSDSIPSTIAGQLLTLIEKIEKVYTLLGVGEIPTSSRDPFGIRRDMYAIIRIIIEGNGIAENNHRITINNHNEFLKLFVDRATVYFKKSMSLISINIDSNKIQNNIFVIKDLYNMYTKINDNFEKLLPYKRLFSFECNSHLHDVVGKFESEFESRFYNTVQNIKTIDDAMSVAPLIDQFFDSVLINSDNSQVKQNRLAIISHTQNSLRMIGITDLLFK